MILDTGVAHKPDSKYYLGTKIIEFTIRTKRTYLINIHFSGL